MLPLGEMLYRFHLKEMAAEDLREESVNGRPSRRDG
jgi:hypothetical protein